MNPTDPALPHIDPQFAVWLRRGGLEPWSLGGRPLLPIVQGGMGIGVPANRLAGSVMRAVTAYGASVTRDPMQRLLTPPTVPA